jgi:PAS domain S-box-containing protein
VVIGRLLSDIGIVCRQCDSLSDLVGQLECAAGAVVAQEGLRYADLQVIAEWVGAQPNWSDFPFVLLSHRGGPIEPKLVEALGNVTVLERPVGQTALISAVGSARRARLRQFEAGEQLAEQSRMRQALAEETRSLGILNELGATLNAELDLERVVQAATDAGVALTSAEFGAFFYDVPGAREDAYIPYARSGPRRQVFASFRIPRDAAGLEPAFSGTGIVRGDDATAKLRFEETPFPIRSYLAVPVAPGSGEVLGVMFFGHSEPAIFSEAMERTMAGVAGQAGTAIDNVRLFQAEQHELEERRRAEAELKRQRDEFLALADNISSLCWLADADGSILWYNRRWHEYTGIQVDIPADEAWAAAQDPELLPEISARWHRALRAGQRFEMIFPLRREDGVHRQFLTRIVPICDETGTIVRWCGTHADITEQRETETALEARVAERTAELQRALDRLQAEAEERGRVEDALRQSQKMEAIGQLTGSVAHDFNNLLTVILSGADALRRSDISEERRARYVNAIAETADRAAKLTSQLLAFARRQPLLETVFDAAENIDRTVEMLRTIVGSRITLSIDLKVAPAPVKADIAQFETALVNMAVNARDAMEGEGSIHLTVEECTAIPPTRAHPIVLGRFISVSIADNGTGLTAEQIERIFEPFYTTKEIGKGTGLGLSQVYGFVKQSGGDVRVESAAGQGATFILYLPRVSEAALGPRPPPEEEIAEGGGGGRILVVEDNETVGEHASQLLRDLGYEAVLSPDARSALHSIESMGEPFDLVLTDVVMPGAMSGVELARSLARSHPALPVVLTTGYSDVLVAEGTKGIELLRKPYSAAALGSLVRRVLNSSSSASSKNAARAVEEEADR